MPVYLIHKPTGDRYIYHPEMAKRPDMEMVDEPDIAPVPPPGPKRTKRKVIEETVQESVAVAVAQSDPIAEPDVSVGINDSDTEDESSDADDMSKLSGIFAGE